MKLIVNADDFGRTRGITYGIIESMLNGVVSSTTIMMNMPYAEAAIDLAKKWDIKNIGVHLTFVEKSLSGLDSLSDENGIFKSYEEIAKFAKLEDIKTEMELQIQSLINLGINPTHLDGHHHFYLHNGKMLEATKSLARKYKLPIRLGDLKYTHGSNEAIEDVADIKTTEKFNHEYYGGNIDFSSLTDIIEKNKEAKTLEIMVHPGLLCNDTLISSYNKERLIELDVLTSDEIKTYLKENEIELIGYGKI